MAAGATHGRRVVPGLVVVPVDDEVGDGRRTCTNAGSVSAALEAGRRPRLRLQRIAMGRVPRGTHDGLTSTARRTPKRSWAIPTASQPDPRRRSARQAAISAGGSRCPAYLCTGGSEAIEETVSADI